MSSIPFPANRTYYPALDVLRGIAILLVLLYHNFHFLQVFQFGWAGVDLFFVLSGFLITDILIVSQGDKNYFRNFYARRLLRIFPLYYGTLIGFLCLSPLFFSKENMVIYEYYSRNQLWFWSDLQNWLFVHKGLAPSPYLTHFWSLAVEEQFYFVWPLLIYFMKDLKKIRITVIALILIALIVRISIWYQYPGDMERYYCNTLTRMDSLLMGCLLSIHLKEGKEFSQKAIRYTLISCLAYFAFAGIFGKSLNNTNPYLSTVGYTVTSIFFASLIYVFVKTKSKPLTWVKQLPLLNYVGKISYGIYVFHIPVYLVLSSVLMKLLHDLEFSPMLNLLLISTASLIVTLIASSISFYLFEKPFLSLKRHFQ